jgi:hypothetical protein
MKRLLLLCVMTLVGSVLAEEPKIKFDNADQLAAGVESPHLDIDAKFDGPDLSIDKDQAATNLILDSLMSYDCVYNYARSRVVVSMYSATAGANGYCGTGGASGCEPFTLVEVVQKETSPGVWTQVWAYNFLNDPYQPYVAPPCNDNTERGITISFPTYCDFKAAFGAGNYRFVAYNYPTSALTSSPPNWSGYWDVALTPSVPIGTGAVGDVCP